MKQQAPPGERLVSMLRGYIENGQADLALLA
eukprot:COSAG06_NODE_74523_length_141_cov_208.380952_1_plen_30_part_01